MVERAGGVPLLFVHGAGDSKYAAIGEQVAARAQVGGLHRCSEPAAPAAAAAAAAAAAEASTAGLGGAASARENTQNRRSDSRIVRVLPLLGAQFTCCTGTKVQILTH